jgi:hypothetical protein
MPLHRHNVTSILKRDDPCPVLPVKGSPSIYRPSSRTLTMENRAARRLFMLSSQIDSSSSKICGFLPRPACEFFRRLKCKHCETLSIFRVASGVPFHRRSNMLAPRPIHFFLPWPTRKIPWRLSPCRRMFAIPDWFLLQSAS